MLVSPPIYGDVLHLARGRRTVRPGVAQVFDQIDHTAESIDDRRHGGRTRGFMSLTGHVISDATFGVATAATSTTPSTSRTTPRQLSA